MHVDGLAGIGIRGRLITESRLWVLTLKRTGPLGEAPVLGTKGEVSFDRNVVQLVWIGARGEDGLSSRRNTGNCISQRLESR
jgi:hypothetical protein